MKRKWYLVREDSCDRCPSIEPKNKEVKLEFIEGNQMIRYNSKFDRKSYGYWALQNDSLTLSEIISDSVSVNKTYFINFMSVDSLVISYLSYYGTAYISYKAE